MREQFFDQDKNDALESQNWYQGFVEYHRDCYLMTFEALEMIKY